MAKSLPFLKKSDQNNNKIEESMSSRPGVSLCLLTQSLVRHNTMPLSLPLTWDSHCSLCCFHPSHGLHFGRHAASYKPGTQRVASSLVYKHSMKVPLAAANSASNQGLRAFWQTLLLRPPASDGLLLYTGVSGRLQPSCSSPLLLKHVPWRHKKDSFPRTQKIFFVRSMTHCL